jgi:hypothetical protein
VWDLLSVNDSAAAQSLLKVMVLLSNAPTDFIAKLSPQEAEIATLGRQIRALRPSYLEQQHALIGSSSPLPAVLQSIVASYAEPTPKDIWTEWVRWM